MTTNENVEQCALPDLTTPSAGTLYFAYGSNLSAEQMSLRLPASEISCTPLAIARLDCFKWIICQRGYANIVSLPPDTPATHQSTVWGVIYCLDPSDEAALDNYEGHNEARNPDPEVNPDPKTQLQRPYEQGDWDYNKQYLPVTVTKWLEDPREYGIGVQSWQPTAVHDGINGAIPNLTANTTSPETIVRVLVYVDENRTEPGRINYEYIGRMNRAIDEATALGLPQDWVDEVLRKDVVPGIRVRDDGYVGHAEGFVEAEATEAYDEVTENAIRKWREGQGGGS